MEVVQRRTTKYGRSSIKSPLYFGFPGPPEFDGKLRVLMHSRVARQEGMECFMDYLCSGMPDGAVEWQFVVTTEDDNSGKLIEQYGPVHFINGDSDDMWWKFFRVVADFRPHVVHTSHKWGAEWAAKAGIPCICSVHGITGGESYGSEIANMSIGVSPSATNGTDGIILNGIRPLDFVEEKDGTVVWLGRIDYDRNPLPFLDAVSRSPDVRVKIIGRPCSSDIDIREEINLRGIADRVVYMDSLTPDEARKEAAKSSVIVCAVNESFGFATAEAMTAGVRPVVINGKGYQSVMAAKYGVVVRPTVGGLIEGMKRGLELSLDVEGSRKMAEETRIRYSNAKMASSYLGRYKSLVRPLIDIIVIAWNELEVTKACIRSILANTWTPYNLIMIDNGSDTSDIIDYFKAVEKECEHSIVVRLDENLGAAGGKDWAYQNVSRSEYFFLIDNDMLVSQGWLQRLYEDLRLNPEAAAVSPWNTIYPEHLKGKRLCEIDFHGANALYRRSIIEKCEEEPGKLYASPFREMSGRADTDLMCRIKEAGFQLLFDGEVCLHHLGGTLRKRNFSQGFTRRHLGPEVFNEAETIFQQKWKSFGVRR